MRMMDSNKPILKASSLRWKILRQALIPRSSSRNEDQSEMDTKRISRRTTNGFNLIPSFISDDIGDEGAGGFSVSHCSDHRRDRRVCYTLPIDGASKLFLKQRMDDVADLDDFKICNKYDIDNTGLVCHWPSEDVLAYFCLLHLDLFRCKRVIELGSGYGLAGLVVAASTEASEVVITDGNPQVVEYIQHNIAMNSKAFGGTRVDSLTLHWNQENVSNISGSFDLIIASDCTFFKEYHQGLARTVMSLLKKADSSEAIFFSPKRGDSLVKFLEEIKASGLHFSVTEEYNAEVWKLHEKFSNGDDSWPGYEKDHCYPLLPTLTYRQSLHNWYFPCLRVNKVFCSVKRKMVMKKHGISRALPISVSPFVLSHLLEDLKLGQHMKTAPREMSMAQEERELLCQVLGSTIIKQLVMSMAVSCPSLQAYMATQYLLPVAYPMELFRQPCPFMKFFGSGLTPLDLVAYQSIKWFLLVGAIATPVV